MRLLSSRPAWARVTTLLALLAVSGWAQAGLKYSGSDTVEPVVEAAELVFAKTHAGYKVNTQVNGTASGFRDLCAGLVPVIGASRSIKSQEAQSCANRNVQYVELPVAMDAVVLVTSAKTTWVNNLKMGDVHIIFESSAADKIKSWKQVRPDFPDQPLRTAGVGVKHGTFAFFRESLGDNGFIRSDMKDFTHHEQTAKYVMDNVGAIGFMSMGDARAFGADLKILGIDFGAGVVQPSPDVVLAGKYEKLSRPVYLYINRAALIAGDAQDAHFVGDMLGDLNRLVTFSGLVPFVPSVYQDNLKKLNLPK